MGYWPVTTHWSTPLLGKPSVKRSLRAANSSLPKAAYPISHVSGVRMLGHDSPSWFPSGRKSVLDQIRNMTCPSGTKLGSQSRRAVPFYEAIVSRITAGVKTRGRLKHSMESSGSQPARATDGLRNTLAASSRQPAACGDSRLWGPLGDHTVRVRPNSPQAAACRARQAECR